MDASATVRGVDAARYLARAVARRRRRTLLLLVLLIGIVGGVATGAIAAARRGRTTVDRLEAQYGDPDVTIFSFVQDPGAEEAALRRVVSDARLTDYRLMSSGTLMTLDARHSAGGMGSGGLLALVDIATAGGAPGASSIVEGRAPTAADEVALSQGALDAAEVSVGDDVDISWYHSADLEKLGGGGAAAPKQSRRFHVTGLELNPSELITDARDEPGTIFETNRSVALLAPAFWADAGTDIATYGLGVAADVDDDQRAALEAAAADGAVGVDPGRGSDLEGLAAVRSAINLESVAILAFAGILIGAATLLLGTATARAAAPAPNDLPILGAIGVEGRDRAASAALVGAAIGLPAAALTLLIALGMSTVAPFGYAASAEVARGFDVDTPVIVLGAVGALLFGVVAATLGGASGRRATRAPRTRTSRWSIGPPLGATVGLRLLGQTAHGRSGTALRAAGATAVAGTVAVVAAWTFAGSMGHLVDSPPLQGWTWTFAVGNYSQPDSVAAGAAALAANPDVAAAAGFNNGPMLIDGQQVEIGGMEPVSGGDLDPDGVVPRVLEGRAASGPREIAVGPATLRALGKRVGDTVALAERPGSPSQPFTIVGVVTPPAALADGMTLDEGAVTRLSALTDVVTIEDGLQPYLHLVSLRPGVDPTAARERLQTDFPQVVNTARASADIRSLRTVQQIPYLLAFMIGLTGIGAVVVALGQLARRRQRELAVLRCEGFTSRQLVGVVLAQATIFTAVALLVGIPVGIVTGRSLWRLAADRIGTDVGPQVPMGGIALAVVGLLVAANVMALVPAWRASRVHPAAVLRAD